MEAGHEHRPSSAGLTSLMLACQQGLEYDVKSIILRKPDIVHQRDRSGKSALHYCAENTNLACAEQILAVSPDLVNVQDEEGYSPLHLAVISGNKSMARFFIKKGADVGTMDNEKHSCVHWATVCGELDCLDLLVDNGADPSTPDIHGAYPVHYAAQMCGPNSEMGNNVRLGLAVLKKLLARGVDVNCKDQDGRQPLLWAASAGSSDAILALINAGAKVCAEDKDGLTALHCAASRGHLDCLETLITLCGAEVDVIDSNGCSALFYAATLGHADCTHLLLKFGADANRQDRRGRTPAHCGAAKGQLETLKILAQNGANLWLRNVRGDMPLHEAVQSGRKDLIQWLLEQQQGSVNVSNSNGRTPLHIAAITNNVEMCKVLMDNGAFVNPIMRNSKCQLMTPLDAALYRSNRGCAKYLQLHGALPASKFVEKNEYNRSLILTMDASSQNVLNPGSLESIPERRMLRESGVQTEMDHRDADVQVHLERRRNDLEGGDIIHQLHQELVEQNRGDARADGNRKPIIAKVYVHTKRGRDKKTSRRPDDKRDVQELKKDTCERGGGHEKVTDALCGDKICSDKPKDKCPETDCTNRTNERVCKGKKAVHIRVPPVPGKEDEEQQKMSHHCTEEGDSKKEESPVPCERVKEVCGCCDLERDTPSPEKCSCECHVSRDPSEEKDRDQKDQDQPTKGKAKESDADNHSPLSSIRSIESNVKDSGFSDDLERDNADASSEGDEGGETRECRRKKKVTVRHVVSSGATDVVRAEEKANDDPPRAASMPTLQQKDDKVEGCHRLLSRPTITKEVQKSLRKYQLERRLFHELQELKRHQICGGRAGEQATVKRMVERFRRHVLCPGMKDFQGSFTFRAFEKYLYEQLRRLSMNCRIPKPKPLEDPSLRSYPPPTDPSESPALCVCRTHKCHHATQAYAGHQALPQKVDTARHVVLPEIIPTPVSNSRRNSTTGFQSKIPVSRSKSWDRLESTRDSPSLGEAKLNSVISNSLPTLTAPVPKKVPASLLAAIGQRLANDVHPDDTIVIEMSAEDFPTKLRRAYTVREIQQAVKQCEAAGAKVRPFSLESVLDPEDDGPVTFEIRHGREKNVFRLPAEKLKDNKKWFLHYCLWPVGRYILPMGEDPPATPADLDIRTEVVRLSPRSLLLLPNFRF